MRERSLAGGPGAPGVADIIRQRNVATGLGVLPGQLPGAPPASAPAPGPSGLGPPAAPPEIASPGIAQPGWQNGTYGINADQVRALRDAALRGAPSPLGQLNRMGFQASGAGGMPTIADIIRAQNTRYNPA